MQRFECPRCSGQFQIEAGMVGKQVACPHCRGHVQIPDSSQGRAGAEAPDAPRGMHGFEDQIPDPPTIPHTAIPHTAIPHTATEKSPDSSSKEERDNRSGTCEPVVSDPMAPVVPNPVLAEDNTSEYSFCPSAVAVVESGTNIEVEEHPKTIIHKGRVIPLRRLTPEEKKRRRRRRTMILVLVSGAILVLWLLYGAGKI